MIPKIIKNKKQTERGVLYRRTCAYCGETVEFYHAEKPSHCPHCGSFNYIKPKTETKLFLLQKKYLEEGRDKDVLGHMYLILKGYAKSMVKSEIGGNAMTKYHYSDIDIKSSDAAVYLLEYYLTKPQFKIEQSFGGYLSKKVSQALYNKKDQKEDKVISYNTVIGDNEGHTEELGDLPETLNLRYIFGDENKYREKVRNENELLSGIEKILNSTILHIKKTYSSKDSMLLIIGLYLKLSSNNQKVINDYYRFFGSEYRNFIDQVLLILYEFIKESQNYHQKEL